MIIIQVYYLRLITLFYLLSFGPSDAALESSSTTPNLTPQDNKKNGQSEERQGKDVGLVVHSKRSIRRKAQLALCNAGCYSNPNCQNSVDSCKWCVQGRCQVAPSCGTSCSTTNDCYAASNGCNSCVQGRCQIAPKCGTGCSSNTDCTSATPCNYCVNWVCSQQPSCGTPCSADYQCSYGNNQCTKCIGYFCNQPQCGSSCITNSDCYFAPAGCNICYNSRCNTSTQKKCNLSCQTDSQCTGAVDGCIYCNGGICVQNRVNPSTCISDVTGLYNAAIGASNQITLCANSKITLTQTMTITRTGQTFTLNCNGSCSIVGNNNFPLMVISATTVSVNGITFQNGNAVNGNGGALTLNANSGTFQSCTFTSNIASFKGGAIYLSGQGTFTNCRGSNNQAAQCDDIYFNSNGSCQFLYS